MLKLRNALLVGVTAVGLAGFSGAATARPARTHVLTVPLPGGRVEQIHYAGAIPPRVAITPGFVALDDFVPLATMPSFAMFDRISAQTNLEAAAMLRQAEALASTPVFAPRRLSAAALHHMPAGSESYSLIATMSGNRVCSESVQITSRGSGRAPRVVRHESGDCGALPGPAGAVALPAAPAPRARPHLLEADARGTPAYANTGHETVWGR